MGKNGSQWRAAVVAPHSDAAQVGADVLREGGNALEAMVASAAAIAVLYPHMNGIGGDAFWLVDEPQASSWGINGCGRSAGEAAPGWYLERGFSRIPERGPAAVNTVPGAISSWIEALSYSRSAADGRMPLSRLLEPAIDMARQGHRMSDSLMDGLSRHGEALCLQPGFKKVFMPEDKVPNAGAVIKQPALADVLEELSREGLQAFYKGDIGASLARGLTDVGSPLRREDLEACNATRMRPLELNVSYGKVRNLPLPTQGLASLLILGLYERYRNQLNHEVESADYVHALVEATKRAFQVRDAVVTDPDYGPDSVEEWLTLESLDQLADDFDPLRAAAWPSPEANGDTVWLGAIDAQGRQVSFIQSIFHEFGSGVLLPDTGILCQNRGCSFQLKRGSMNEIAPNRQPFQTLNPAMAELEDGRRIIYGTMGGHGQPQTQAAVLTRLIYAGADATTALERPRWLLGRTWGEGPETLKIESNFPDNVVEALIRRGHDVTMVPELSNVMGHAGALIRHPQGGIEAASDPRSDGGVFGVT